MSRPPLLASLTLLSLCGAGCASLTDGGAVAETFSGLIDKGEPEVRLATEDDPVIEVVAFWSPTEGAGPSGTPVKGFSGRILLLNAGGDDPVVADGAVRLYLFSDAGDRAQRAKPVNQIDVPPQQWRECLAISNLGPGYEVFVPYPTLPEHSVRCSLRVRFTPVVGEGFGEPLFSAAVGATLDGPPDPNKPRQSHTMTTETIVPGPVVPHRIKSDPKGVVPAVAAEPAPGRVTPAASVPATPGLSGLDPAAQARIAKALEALRKSSGAGDTAPDFSRNRSPFADAEKEDGPTPPKRFDLAPGRPAAPKPAAALGGPRHPLAPQNRN